CIRCDSLLPFPVTAQPRPRSPLFPYTTLFRSAGLWYANIGHGRREVIEAVHRQMEKLPAFHCFVDFGTRPTLELAERIAAVSPDPGSKVFFGQGGSDAVDTAAKLARRYFSAIGQPERTVFIAREW